ncbi:hypothetical protein D3C72_1871650 [compost metagenome]
MCLRFGPEITTRPGGVYQPQSSACTESVPWSASHRQKVYHSDSLTEFTPLYLLGSLLPALIRQAALQPIDTAQHTAPLAVAKLPTGNADEGQQ